MKVAAQIGIDYDKFLDITPKVLNIYAKAYEKEREFRQKESIYQAYLVSRWVWQKRVDIEKILNSNIKPQKNMTDEQMFAKVKMLNTLFGGEVKTVKPTI